MARKKKSVSKKRTAKKTAAGSRPIFHDLARQSAEGQTEFEGVILPEFRIPNSGQNRNDGIARFSHDQQQDPGRLALPPVDAWFGSFGTRASSANLARRMGQSAISARKLMAEVVIGDDDREQVNDTRQYPFGCICSLEIVSSSNRRYVGTGWLIAPDTVVTAGHCVYLHNEGGWAKSIAVFPGRNGAEKPIERYATGMYSVQGWLRDKQPAFDYSSIRLNSPVSDIGSFGYRVASDRQLKRYNCHVVGYPSDKAGTMWGHVRRLKEVREKTLIYDIDTYGGNSGGPVFVVLDNRVLSIGIHNYGDLSGNSATRITADVFDNLDNWKK